MLVLTRKVGEGVKIDENIFVRVVQVKGKQVRIGIEAPKETRIQREELDAVDGSGAANLGRETDNQIEIKNKQ